MYPQPPIVWMARSVVLTATSLAASLDIDPAPRSNGIPVAAIQDARNVSRRAASICIAQRRRTGMPATLDRLAGLGLRRGVPKHRGEVVGAFSQVELRLRWRQIESHDLSATPERHSVTSVHSNLEAAFRH
ncbi:MAG: hypothetical protein JWR37_2866 [Mycobacterium sp.]|nr:hypothetical protein [Mycobacterium sp.]